VTATVPAVSRRSFIVVLGATAGGLALGVRFEGDLQAATGLDAGPFVHVGTDGRVRIVCHRSEMGQGIRSSLPVVIADEMGADWKTVEVVQGDADERYGDQNTDGSQSVRDYLHLMRQAGATARTMLVAAAAQSWSVPAARLTTRDGAVHDTQTGRSLRFGELAAAASALPVPSADAVVLRPDAELLRTGKELPLVDGPAFVTGTAAFAADVRIPGMLTAVIARPPVLGAAVARVEDAAALKVPGVRRVFTLPAWKAPAGFQPLGGVAVVADTTWAALRGRAALSVDWSESPHGSYESGAYRDALLAAVRAPGQVVRRTGDVEPALKAAAKVVTAEYHVPLLAHASMEPPAAVARVDANGCEIWACTQNPQGARDEVAKALGIDKTKVTLHVTFLGGGFGRKSKPDFIVEAALVSREVKAPVRVQWTRTDDLRHDYFHACATQRLSAGLEDSGNVIAWHQRVASPSIGSTFDTKTVRLNEFELSLGLLDLPLAIPAVQMEACEAPAHVRIGWLRSVYNINHAFAVQSFIGELAHASGRDPRAMLLSVIGPARQLTAEEAGVPKIPNYGQPLDRVPIDVGRWRRVIERVTASANWDAARKNGRALGLAAHHSFLTYVAVVVAASKDADGRPRIDEAWICADAGFVVNPDRVRSQLEGAVIFGITTAFHGAITAKDGAIVQSNFRDYPVARMVDAPRAIHVDLVQSTARPGGVGEPGLPPVAPAIANALFALTGERIRSLPLRSLFA
jgi:isoquinoline 1-oxidoreductase subunit beta